jgi:hypothetical protein
MFGGSLLYILSLSYQADLLRRRPRAPMPNSPVINNMAAGGSGTADTVTERIL